MRTWFASMRDDDGQAMVEYALILALVSIATIALLTTVGTSINTVLQAVIDGLAAA
jgi:pilus assembly protein Flp/PilA